MTTAHEEIIDEHLDLLMGKLIRENDLLLKAKTPATIKRHAAKAHYYAKEVKKITKKIIDE